MHGYEQAPLTSDRVIVLVVANIVDLAIRNVHIQIHGGERHSECGGQGSKISKSTVAGESNWKVKISWLTRSFENLCWESTIGWANRSKAWPGHMPRLTNRLATMLQTPGKFSGLQRRLCSSQELEGTVTSLLSNLCPTFKTLCQQVQWNPSCRALLHILSFLDAYRHRLLNESFHDLLTPTSTCSNRYRGIYLGTFVRKPEKYLDNIPVSSKKWVTTVEWSPSYARSVFGNALPYCTTIITLTITPASPLSIRPIRTAKMAIPPQKAHISYLTFLFLSFPELTTITHYSLPFPFPPTSTTSTTNIGPQSNPKAAKSTQNPLTTVTSTTTTSSIPGLDQGWVPGAVYTMPAAVTGKRESDLHDENRRPIVSAPRCSFSASTTAQTPALSRAANVARFSQMAISQSGMLIVAMTARTTDGRGRRSSGGGKVQVRRLRFWRGR